MELNDIIQHLRSTKFRDNFDAWVSINIKELTNFFYTLPNSDLIELKFDTDFYFKEFTKSPVFKDFEVTRQHSDAFDAFLFLLAYVAEKLAEQLGLTGTIDHLLEYLPESSVKYRLKAVSLSQNIDNIKIDYIKFFPQILKLLQRAETLEEENHNLRLVDFLIYYFIKAEKKLTTKNYLTELEILKQEYTSESNISQYHFLRHISVQELIRGRYPHELEFENIKLTILYPSLIIEALFKYNINKPVLSHNDSKGIEVLMGYKKEIILNDILNRGKTKFDEQFESLEPKDKVLLYCFFNMKKHFFTSIAVFKKMWTSLNDIFANKSYLPVFIDLGCGPLTSGLALAELYQIETGKAIHLNYIGIDISDAMIDKAKEFSECELFDKKSDFQFYNSWNDIEQGTLKKLAGKNNPFFLNASYLFSNLSEVLVYDLAKFVKKQTTKFKNVHFIFQNPDRVDRNEKWKLFKTQLKFDQINKTQTVEHVVYKTSRSELREAGNEDVYYEILTLKD